MALLTKINNTIKYAKRFGGGLNLDQLWFRLLSDKIYSKKEIRNKITNYELRITNCEESNKKVRLAEGLVKKHLTKFSDILMVGITGSVAAENAKKYEDIDLFIICKKDTMWWTRLGLRIYIKLINIPHRKFGQKEKPNDFCFNLWMDESDLLVPKLKQTQKNAVDLILIKVLLNRNNIFEKLILENNWASKFVATGYGELCHTRLQAGVTDFKSSIITKGLNYIAYIGQYLYIRLKGPVKFITLRQAFFHIN